MNSKHFNPKNHIFNLANDPYYFYLAKIRNELETLCDEYFQKLGAIKTDLFLITKSVSSPIGLGSDSKPLPLTIDGQKAFLVDSAQFGMESLVQGKFNIVYCYLPSFRGEKSDERHLNQFYHCEAELKGDYKKAMNVAENLTRYILDGLVKNIKANNFRFKNRIIEKAQTALKHKFPQITFSEAEKILKSHSAKQYVEHKKFGRIISREGELMLTKLVTNNESPVWITNYDRDTVAFYQKPNPNNTESVLNADLIFPSINGGFGGEIIGLGQRQNKVYEMIQSMKRQKIKNIDSYSWYMDIRKFKNYRTTSGFGMGIERFLAWTLGIKDISEVSLFPIAGNGNASYY